MRHGRRDSFFAGIMLVLLVSGCAGKQAPSRPSQKRPSPMDVSEMLRAQETSASEKAAQRGAETTLKAITDHGSLAFGVETTNFPASFADRITRTMFTDKVKMNLVFEGASFEPLRTRMADVVIASWPPGEDRTMYYASPPIYTDSIRLIVPEGTTITTIGDLQGKVVGYAKKDSRSSVERLRRYLDSKKQSVDIRFEEFDELMDAADAMVRERKISAVIGPASELQPIVHGGYGMTALLPEQYYTWTYNVYVLKQNVGLVAAVDKAVRQMTDSGDLDRVLEEHDMRI